MRPAAGARASGCCRVTARDWGRAMLAELAALEDGRARRRFALGCLRAVLVDPGVLRTLALYAVTLGFAVVVCALALGDRLGRHPGGDGRAARGPGRRGVDRPPARRRRRAARAPLPRRRLRGPRRQPAAVVHRPGRQRRSRRLLDRGPRLRALPGGRRGRHHATPRTARWGSGGGGGRRRGGVVGADAAAGHRPGASAVGTGDRGRIRAGQRSVRSPRRPRGGRPGDGVRDAAWRSSSSPSGPTRRCPAWRPTSAPRRRPTRRSRTRSSRRIRTSESCCWARCWRSSWSAPPAPGRCPPG